MAINKLSFGGTGNAVNPLSTFGDDLIKTGNNIQQQELNRLAAERADKELALRQQAEDRAQKQYDDAQAAKAAGAEYMKNLADTQASGVIGLGDQKKIAALSQDQSISPEERARRIDALMPKMTQAYDVSPAERLRLLQSVTRPANMDAKDAVALQGIYANPLEKNIEQTQNHGFRMKEIEEQNKNARELEGLKFANEQDVVKLRSQEDYNKTLFYDAGSSSYKYGRELAKMPEADRNKYKPLDVYTTELAAAKQVVEEATKTTNAKWDPDQNRYIPVPKGTPGSAPVASHLFAPGAASSGGGAGGLNKTLQTDKEINTTIKNLTTAGFDNSNTARDEIAASRKMLDELGVPQQIQDDIIATGTSIGVRPSVVPWRVDVFDKDAFKEAVNSRLDAYMTKNVYAGVAGGAPTAEKKAMYAKVMADRAIGGKPPVDEVAKNKQIEDMKVRREILKKEAELSPKETEELTRIETRLKAVDAAEKEAAYQKALEEVLAKKPSKLTAEDKKILEAEKIRQLIELGRGFD